MGKFFTNLMQRFIQVWEFSKSQRKIDEWNNESTLPLTNHLHECEFNVVKKYDVKKIALPCCIAQD